jgi:hypothetical protein
MIVKFRRWATPNFAQMVTPAKPRQEGWYANGSVHVRDIPVEDLALLCAQFRADVFEKAGRVDPGATTGINKEGE